MHPLMGVASGHHVNATTQPHGGGSVVTVARHDATKAYTMLATLLSILVALAAHLVPTGALATCRAPTGAGWCSDDVH